MALTEEMSSHDLLQAHDELLHETLSYAKSVALAVALDLRIPDAIHRHGGGATLPQILAGTALHPCKLRALGRLMRVLTVNGTFSVVPSGAAVVGASDEAAVYRLTAASRFLVSDEVSSASLAAYVGVLLRPLAASPHATGFCAWFRQERNDPPPYALAFRQELPTLWEHGDDINVLLNKGMVAQSRFLMPIVLRECGEVFRGIDSLVDAGGGHGGAAATIAAAFPNIKCSVLDLPHVVAGAPSHSSNVQFVGGNFFESIPPATAVFLKRTLHDWGDEECVKILKNCRKAISPRDAGGKVILVEMVVGHGQPNIKQLETQVVTDMFIMMVNGAERDEQEWKKIFTEAGFKEYKILPVAGASISVIEVYP